MRFLITWYFPMGYLSNQTDNFFCFFINQNPIQKNKFSNQSKENKKSYFTRPNQKKYFPPAKPQKNIILDHQPYKNTSYFLSNQAKKKKKLKKNEMRDEPNLRISGANDFGVVKFVSEANHEAAKGLVAVKTSIVCAHALQRHVYGRPRREGE